MPGVPLGLTSYRRRGARTAEVALVNMLVEKDPTNQIDGLLRFQRPGLASWATVGDGPIRGIFRRLGVLSSLYYVVSGTSLYSVTTAGVSTLLGSITGTDLVSIDGSASRLIVVSEGVAYSWDGTSLTTITVPDIDSVASPISCVVYINGYFILPVLDSQHFFWLAPGDTNPDALNFASAENSPDNIIVASRLQDEIWFFGSQTTEVFQLTGDSDAPFQPIGGRLYERGCANKDALATLDNTLFFIGNDLIAYRCDTTPIRISDHSMEERLRVAGANNLRAWAFEIDGHTLYSVRCANVGTFVYDVENQNWLRFKSYSQDYWRAHLGVQVSGDLVIAGDDTNGTLWQLDQARSNDNGDPLERELTGGVTVLGKPQKCRDVSLAVPVGWSDIVGPATNPKVSLRYSDDGGNIWSSWLELALGLQGQYITEVIARRLGIIRSPGRLFNIRMTDDAIFRISYMRMNEGDSI